jgi:hypothetical protein
MKKRDLMITLFLSMAVLFLCQTALASSLFNARLDFKAGRESRSVAIGDLDGDGALDPAVANRPSDNVSVLINSLYIPLVYPKGWSMISLPVDPPDKRLDKLFPEAGVVYGYEKGTGYVRVKPNEDLDVGRGYWILFDKVQPYIKEEGAAITEYTMPVADGWYMIGGCTYTARVIPHGCDTVVIYKYIQGVGYQRVFASEYLLPGEGYWILLKNADEGATITVERVD